MRPRRAGYSQLNLLESQSPFSARQFTNRNSSAINARSPLRARARAGLRAAARAPRRTGGCVATRGNPRSIDGRSSNKEVRLERFK